MARVAYVNGAYVPQGEAAVHVEDRGYQFSDGVYEVIALHGGKLVDGDAHLDRLDRSLGELRIPWPMSRRALEWVMAELLRRNHLADGTIYLQVTRGVARRIHAFPPRGTPSSLVMTVRPIPAFDPDAAEKGVAIVTAPDLRWKRRDIKTIGLLPNVLAKQDALDAGAFDTWMVDDDGLITEGTASNAWIVTGDGAIRTRPCDPSILRGITRETTRAVAAELGLDVVERPFTPDEAKAAREAFLTSTTNYIRPVVSIDGVAVGDGGPGPVVRRLRAAYGEHFA